MFYLWFYTNWWPSDQVNLSASGRNPDIVHTFRKEDIFQVLLLSI